MSGGAGFLPSTLLFTFRGFFVDVSLHFQIILVLHLDLSIRRSRIFPIQF